MPGRGKFRHGRVETASQDDDYNPYSKYNNSMDDQNNSNSVNNGNYQKIDGSYGNSNNTNTGRSRDIVCYGCGETGHMSRECPSSTGRSNYSNDRRTINEDLRGDRRANYEGSQGYRRSQYDDSIDDRTNYGDSQGYRRNHNEDTRGDRRSNYQYSQDRRNRYEDSRGDRRGNHEDSRGERRGNHEDSRGDRRGNHGDSRGDRRGNHEESRGDRRAPFEDRNNDRYGSKNFSKTQNSSGAHGIIDDEEEQPEVDRPARATFVPDEYNIDEIRSQMNTGINYERYESVELRMTGKDKPYVIDSFQKCNLPEVLRETLRKSGYNKPTPVQKGCIPIVRAGRDMIACAQTGSGKTAAFLIPVIADLIENETPSSHLPPTQRIQPKVIICGPTRELIDQIARHTTVLLANTDFRAVVNYGGTLVSHVLQNIREGCDILVATPGRLRDHLQRGIFNMNSARFLILDEADRMLEQGNGFRDIMEYVMSRFNGDPQILLLSATMPIEVQEFAGEILNNSIYLQVGIVNAASSDVVQEVLSVTDKQDTLSNMLAEMKDQKVLVFAEKKDIADYLGLLYAEEDIWPTDHVLTLHGNRSQEQRTRALDKFRRLATGALFATSVAARGLDIPQIDTVINYDMPRDINEYVHRVGRTGRCGRRGHAITFFHPRIDGNIASDLIGKLEECQQDIPQFLRDCAITGGDNHGSRHQPFRGLGPMKTVEVSNRDGPHMPAQEEEDDW